MARLQVLSAAVLFGTTGTAQTLAPEIEPLVVGASRIAVGAALLLLVALLVGRMRVGGGRGAVLLGGACVAVYQATFFAAVAKTGVAVAAVVALGSAPVFTGRSRAPSPASASTGAGPRPPHSRPPAWGCSCWVAARTASWRRWASRSHCCRVSGTPAMRCSASACFRRAGRPRA